MPDVVDRDWVRSAAPHSIDNFFGRLALTRAEAQIGDTVAAENYYQYAEHYFRSMSSD